MSHVAEHHRQSHVCGVLAREAVHGLGHRERIVHVSEDVAHQHAAAADLVAARDAVEQAGAGGIDLGMLVIAANYRFMMQRCPERGGTFAYTRQVFGHDHSFLCAWFLCLIYIAILWANETSLALIARTMLGPVFQFGFHYTIAGYDVYLGEVLLEVAAVLVCSFLCIRSKRLALALQTVLAVILLSGVLYCFFACLGSGSFSEPTLPPFAGGKRPWMQVVGLAALTPWAYAGNDDSSLSHIEPKIAKSREENIIFVA